MHDDHEKVQCDWRIPDELWAHIVPLLPPRTPPESVKFPGARRTTLPWCQDEKAFQDPMVRTEIDLLYDPASLPRW
jgi:hypothetical protein